MGRLVVASEITAALLWYNQHEKKSSTEGVGSSEGVGLATRYNQDGRKEKDKPRKKKGSKWFHCLDFGHVRRECPKWKKTNVILMVTCLRYHASSPMKHGY